jgi:hypothetical protein
MRLDTLKLVQERAEDIPDILGIGNPQQNSKDSTTKRKDGQMEPYEIKNLLHKKKMVTRMPTE